MNVASPRPPSGAPSGRASTMNTSASTFEQKYFSPWRRHSAPSGTARVVFAPDVAAALALGEEHPAFPRFVGIEAREAAQHLVADRRAGA